MVFSYFRTLAMVVSMAFTATAYGQELAGPPASAPIAPGTPAPDTPPGSEPIDKRILGVLTNYRTANMDDAATPMTARGKMAIAAKDSFDYPSYILAFATSGLGQLSNANPSFGQGMAGYARRYSTGVADQVIGNMLTEGIMPSLLHEDPRYFRMATGPGWTRLRYALTRTLITRTDKGSTRLNFSELVGNGIGAGIGNAYYPDGRHLGDNVQRWGTQIATDTLSNVIKEFWPDLKRKFKR
jgi:hypothetical protein